MSSSVSLASTRPPIGGVSVSGFPFIGSPFIRARTALLCVAVGLGATNAAEIAGIVADSSGTPLAGVRIQIMEISMSVATDNWGWFRIRELKPGRYTIKASHLGFRDEVIVAGVQEENGGRADFHLMPEPIEQAEVLIVARRDGLEFGSGGDLKISQHTWESSGARDVGDVLREMPGVVVLEGDGRQRISLRGSPARAVKVDMDGVPLNDAGTGEADLSAVALDRLREIAVEFEGFGGQVHLWSADPELDDDASPRLEVSIGRSDGEAERYGLGGGARLEEWRGSLDYRRKDDPGDFRYRLDDGTQRRRINNWSNLRSGEVRLGLKREGWASSGSGYWESSRRGIPGLIYTPPTPTARLDSERSFARWAIQRPGQTYQSSATAYVMEYRSRFTSPESQLDPESGVVVRQIPEDNRQTGIRYGLNSAATAGDKSARLKISYRYQRDEYHSDDLLRGKPIIASRGLGSAVRDWHQMGLGSVWKRQWGEVTGQLNPGGNWDAIADNGGEAKWSFSPGISARVDIQSDFITMELDAGWGRSVAAPPFNARFLTESVWAVGNPNLKPENGESYSAGAAVNSDWSGGDGRVGVNLFKREVRDLIVWRRNFQGKYYPDNLAAAALRGAEWSVQTSVWDGAISLFGSYINQRAVNDTPGDINRGRKLPLTAARSGTARLTGRRWRGTGTIAARWAGRRYSTESNQDPLSTAGMGLTPYVVWDMNAARDWQLGRVDITTRVGVDNIFNRTYRIVERSPMPGRTAYFELNVAIGKSEKVRK